ncbi:MAG: alpha-isopropylmalate synthase regulatory domain-containing protein, partial [Archaeoglobaceae archaeon]
PNTPLVGDTAFTHESGIHSSALLQDSRTYEPISPESVGRKRVIVLGKHAGKASVEAILKELGYSANQQQLEEILARIKELGDKGKRVTDADVRTIVETVLQVKSEKRVKLEDFAIVTGKNTTPMASVRLRINGEEKIETAIGVGPVDAAINAIRKAIKSYADVKFVSYSVEAITGGTDALVDVVIQLKRGNKIVTARGARADIVMASVEAFVEGLNMLI